MKLNSIILASAVFIIILSCAQEKQEQKIIPSRDWSSPENIDPFQENVGDFLENDLRDYMIRADQAYWNKEYKKAAQNYLYLISHNVYDIISTYNLSCTYALLKKPELSARFLFRAIDLGFVDFNYIKKDTDFDPVRDHPLFKTALDSIGEMIKNLGDEIVIEAKSLMKCRINKPLGFYPDEKYTMVIGLHGHSSNQDQMIKLWRYFDIPEFIFIVPQAPFSVPIGQANEFRWNIDEISAEVKERSEKLSEEYVIELIKQMRYKYNVGEIYLLGMHQGSSVAFDVAFDNPLLVNGVISFGTDYNINKVSDKKLSRSKNMKFFIVNSQNDIYVDQDRTEELKERFQEYGIDHVYHEINEEFAISRDVLKKSERWFLGK